MKTWRNIWATIALTGLAAAVCGIQLALVPSAIGALMYVACTVDLEHDEDEDFEEERS
jgi:hypothetical protein